MLSADESILTSRMTAQTAKQNSIANDIMIDGITYNFEAREFPEFSIVIPKNFKILEPELANIKYPYADKPNIILCNEDATVDIAFDYNNRSINELEDRINIYRGVIKRLHPSNVFLSRAIYSLSDGNEVACYEFRSPALDGDIHNINFFADLHDKELFGWFICPADMQGLWEPLARQMIASIEVEKED